MTPRTGPGPAAGREPESGAEVESGAGAESGAGGAGSPVGAVTRTGPGGRTLWFAAGAVALALLFAGWATVTALGRDGAGPSAASAVPGADSADAGFARDMSVHHQQAVEMSFAVRDRTDDEEVRRLAYDIANTQANQRGMMLGWLDLWGLPKAAPDREPMAWMGGGHGAAHGGGDGHGGHTSGGATGGGPEGGPAGGGALMPGMATRAELERLRAADGVAAEVLYLQLMIDHHEGGVAMARGCVDACRVDVQRGLARGMVDAQQSEIDLMTGLLAARGARPRG